MVAAAARSNASSTRSANVRVSPDHAHLQALSALTASPESLTCGTGAVRASRTQRKPVRLTEVRYLI